MNLHKIIDEVDFRPQMAYPSPYDHIEKYGEQIVHTPKVVITHKWLHSLSRTQGMDF